jgi:hypothetical protein
MTKPMPTPTAVAGVIFPASVCDRPVSRPARTVRRPGTGIG